MAFSLVSTVIENHRKSRIHYCEPSELLLYFEWTKVHYKMPKMVILASEFLKMRHFEEFSNTVRKLVSTAFIYKLWEVIYNRDGGSVVPKNKVEKWLKRKLCIVTLF